MKKMIFCSLLAAVMLSLPAGDSGKTPQEQYIARYGAMAVSEMYRTGVPASITLAQGLLESRYGLSPLASEGNNHFGIKCHDWKGKTMRQDDDRRNECFRVYGNAEESFQDHSDFLRYRDRYKFLFDFKVTDYKAWAYGLRKAGYATDPSYPEKLIKLIEDYNLSEYDRMSVKEAEKTLEVTQAPAASDSKKAARTKKSRVKKSKDRNKDKNKNAALAAPEDFIDDTQTVIPESPLHLEEATKFTPGKGVESFRFSLSRQMYSKNGVPFLYSMEGETIASIAEDNHLFVREVLKYNDMEMVEKLAPGTVIYLQPKKNQSVKGLDKYIVDQDGEQLRDIAQRFAIKLESLEKMNGLGRDAVLREGDTIILRGESLGSKVKGKVGGLFKKSKNA